MISRIAWVAAGAVAGAYATVKGRRVAYRLSVPGVVDQAAALGTGWREFRAEMTTGMTSREHDLRTQLGQTPRAPVALESDPNQTP